jgi:hypothetical protein
MTNKIAAIAPVMPPTTSATTLFLESAATPLATAAVLALVTTSAAVLALVTTSAAILAPGTTLFLAPSTRVKIEAS